MAQRGSSFVLTDAQLRDVELAYPHKKGLCVVFNQKSYTVDVPTRVGTDFDLQKLESTFEESLEFKVESFTDLTCDSVKKQCANIAKVGKNYSCLVMVILTHGHGDQLYFKDGLLDFQIILSYFKGNHCEGLLGKPKLFFLQACRGDLSDKGTLLKTEAAGDHHIRKIPIESDILIHYSSPKGFESWRDLDKGSWFIQELCTVLENHAKQAELLDMLTLVNRRVAYGYVSSSDKKQMPSITSQLTRKFYFHSRN